MTEPISITQGFLAQTLFETEQEVLANPRYQGTGEVFNVATFLLSESFRHLMESVGQAPGYGVQGGTPDELVKAVTELRYSDLTEEQKAVVDTNGRVLETLLKDPPARILIIGLIEAYKELERERSEAIPQDTGGSA